ncbi:hypothetical protein HWV62_31213 [Athelia sp. TMB]|nr:hypothetical protein HWV62_31213 [Athelia sp. TMB]
MTILLSLVSRAGDPQPPRFNAAPILRISNYFTGRDLEIDLISRALSRSSNNEPRRFAIHGMPGLGKSQLVLQFSKLAYASHAYTYIFWVPATTIEKLTQGLTSVLYLVDHKDRSDPDQALRLVAARRWLEMSPDNWLLILDDVTADVIPFLREHLPRENSHGAVIITTRTVQVANEIVDAAAQRDCILELKALSTEQSATLLIDAAGLGESGEFDRNSIEKLVNQIGCLPLAVEQAGAYMKQKHIPANELRIMYDENALDSVINWENTLGKYQKRSVLAAFSTLLQDLDEVSPDTRNLLSVLAFFDPESIPLDVVARGAERSKRHLSEKSPGQKASSIRRMTSKLPWRRRKAMVTDDAPDSTLSNLSKSGSLLSLICSKELMREAMNYVEKYSLAQPLHGNSPSLHIHDLVQLVLINASVSSQREQEHHALAVGLLASAFKTIKDPRSPQCWADQGKLDDAMPFYKRALAGREKQLGPEHPDTLTTMSNLGELYREQGKYDEAEPLLARVLRSRETQLGEEHPDTLSVVHGLARLYKDQGKYDEAETLYARVLAGYENQLGAEHPRTLVAVHNFAVLRGRQGRWEEAEELYRRALAGSAKVNGNSHPGTRAMMENLAYLYDEQGRDEEAGALRARFREVEESA